MRKISFQNLIQALEKAKAFFLDKIEKNMPYNGKTTNAGSESFQITESSFRINGEAISPERLFNRSIHIYSHLDADGLSAAAILAKMLDRSQIGYQISILRQLETDYIKEIGDEVQKYNKFIIFGDFGTGQLKIIQQYLPSESYLILDHHKPEDESVSYQTNHINPYFFGFDGSYEISGAGMCYLFAKTMNIENKDLASLAIIGSLGDIQNKGDKGTLIGLNEKILQDAKELDKISTELNIAISRTRPIVQAIAFTLPEKIPGLSNDEVRARNFLESNNIKTTNELNEPRTLLDLTTLEKKTLNKSLLQYAMMEMGLPPSFSKKLITTFYILKDYHYNSPISDAREMSSLLNACGRSDKPSLGIAVLLGDKNALEEALATNRDYRKNLSKAIQWAMVHIRELENVYALYGGENTDEKIIGTIASIMIHSELNLDKPLIAYAESDDDSYKISARADMNIVEKGLDLSVIMQKVCKEMGLKNPAGGHPPAAGAKIHRDDLKVFLEKVDNEVGLMIKKSE